MLYSLLRGDFSAYNVTFFLSGLFVFLSSVSMHEFAHAWAAHKLGDDTARYSGRMTLNPIAHIDPIGAIMILLFGFGWAKPVPVNTLNFKNQRRDMAVTAVAGPVSNLLTAFAFMIVTYILSYAGVYDRPGAGEYFLLFFYWIIMRNIMLAVFNLIPIPPLDGSRILAAVLPDRLYFAYVKYERYFYFIMIAILVTGMFSGPLMTLSGWIYEGFSFIVSLPFRLF